MFVRLGNKISLSALCLGLSVFAQPSPPVVGRNVNMVSGITLADGDPFLQRQNEVSAAVSSVNPLHIFAGANDYRLIDLDGSLKDIPGDENSIAAADSWVGLYKSTDGGRTWRTTMLSGCPLNITQCNDPKSSALKGLIHAADPTMRSGPYGSFFLSFLANNRGTGADGVVAVQRFFDLNNNVKAADDPYVADKLNIIETGTSGQLKDKPWVISDIQGRSFNNGTCSLPTSPTPVKAFNVYASYSNFVGQSADNPHPQIFVARSTDCGLTFERPKKVSASVNTSQGTFLTIDPTNGTVYLFWRQIATAANGDPNAIVFVKSTDGGNTWSNATILATINPFDQETSGGRFRTKAYPTAAVSVDSNGVSRVHVVWSERGVGPSGAARIVMSTSSNGGASWSAPVAVDNNFHQRTVPYAGGVAWSSFNPGNPLGLGHQFQPSIVFAGGLLTVLWADQRNDSTEGTLVCPSSGNYSIKDCREVRVPVGNLASAPGSPVVFSTNIDDATPGLVRRHSIEIFTAQAIPSSSPLFASTRVSQYLYGSRGEAPGVSRTKKTIKQLQYNAPNLPLFQQGQSPFLGDYKDITAQTIIPTGNAANPYIWNTRADNGANTVFHGVWTDNRDVIRPSDGNWRNYTPIKLLNGTGTGLTQNASCVTGQAGMRNQNVYAATIGGGIDAYAIVNSKRLPSSGAPRQFNIVLQNGTSFTRTFNLVISPPANGVTATFKPGAQATPISVNVLPNSSAVRTVWVASASNPSATVTVNITSGSTAISVLLNPDPGSTFVNGNDTPDTTNIVQGNVTVINNDLTNNDLTNNDLTNNDLTNNDLTNNDLTNNDLTNNDLTNNDLTNNDLTNNDLTNNDLTNNDLTNNDLTNNDLTNNDLTNNDLTNGAVTDTSFTLFNKGTTDVALNLKTILRGNTIPPNYKLQLIVHKTYATQLPKLANLGGACGDTYSKTLQNAVLLNVPSPTVTSVTDPTLAEFKAEDQSTGNATVSLLPQESAYVTYRLVYNQTGQNIPQNQAPAFEFGSNGVKVVPVNASSNIIPIPLIISTLSLQPVLAGTAYDFELTAQGGLGARTWSLLNGALPPGITLTPAGKLTGTPTTPGQYTFTARVADQSVPNIQTDKQTLVLTVQGNQTQTLPSGSLMYGASVTLPSSTSAGLPITYSMVSGGCTLSGNVITANSGTGVCSLNASNPGTVIYLPFNQPTSFTLALAPLTVKANDASVTYGVALPAFTATISGLVGSDTPASIGIVTFTTTATSVSGPGTYPITPASPVSEKYAVTYVNGTLTVGKATLTVTANSASRVYGGPNPEFTAAYSGFAGTDAFENSVTGLPGLTTTANATTAVGTQPILASLGTLTSAKYNFIFVNGTLTITRAPLTITAGNASVAYGFTTLPTFTAAFSGLVAPDTADSMGTVTFSTTATGTSTPGTYPIKPAGITSGNYAITYVDGTLTITQAQLTVTASNASATYGFTTLPTFTATFTGLAGGDTPASIGTVTFTTTATSTSVPGTYPVTPAGIVSGNYAVNYVNGALTVGKATLTVKAENASRIYGEPNPTFTASYAGFAGTDTFLNSVTGSPGVTTTATGTTPVGTAPITSSLGTLASTKYDFVFANGTLAITKAPLTVTATSFTRAYGELNPGLTVGFSGFKNSETLATSGVSGAPVLQTLAGTTSPVASAPYAIVVSQGTLNAANYSFLLVNGGLTIIKATPVFSNLSPTVVFQGAASNPIDGTISYVPVGSPAVFPSGTVSVTLNGETKTAAIGSAGAFSTAAFNTSNLTLGSSYPVSFTYAGDANFNAATAGSLTVKVAGFQSTGAMAAARSFHTATLLNGGRVLVAGGFAANGQSLASAEVYDPSSGNFTPTANNMPNKAAGHTATLMGNGKVLLVGGGNSSAQVYDPATNSWSSTGGSGQRTYHTAVLLPNGRVLIAGGSDNAGKTTNTAQLYNPATGTFSATGSMVVSRDWHTASLLPDGRVLIAGGRTTSGNSYTHAASAEIYDPATGRFTATGAMTAARSAHTAVLVNGKVLVSGGANSNTTAAIATADIYDPATGTWSTAGPMGTPRRAFTSTTIGTSVLTVGGFSGSTRHPSTELYNGTAFTPWGPMSAARSGHTATALNDGRVLIVGGQGTAGSAVNTAEVYGQ